MSSPYPPNPEQQPQPHNEMPYSPGPSYPPLPPPAPDQYPAGNSYAVTDPYAAADPYAAPDPYAAGTPYPPASGAAWQQPPAQPQAPGYPQSPPAPTSAWPQDYSQPGYQQPPAAPTPKGMSTGKLALIIGGGLMALCCVSSVIFALVGGSSDSKSKNDSRPSAAATTPGAAKTTKPAKDPTSEAIIAWYDGGGKQHMDAFSSDADKLVAGANKVDLAAIRTACVSLQGHAEAAQAYKHLPDDEAQRYWAASLASYARAATDCVAGVDAGNTDLITKAGTEMETGSNSMTQLAARLKTLEGN